MLRRTRPELDRPYKTWGYPFVPLLFALMAFLIVGNTMVNDFKNSFWGLVVVFTGLPAYWYWSRKRERVTQGEASAGVERAKRKRYRLASISLSVVESIPMTNSFSSSLTFSTASNLLHCSPLCNSSMMSSAAFRAWSTAVGSNEMAATTGCPPPP